MKTTKISTCVLGGLALLAFSGCDAGPRNPQSAAALGLPPEPKASSYTLEDAAKLRRIAPAARAADKDAAPSGSEKSDDKTPAPVGAAAANDANTGRVKAEPGVAAKDFGGGPLGQPFEVYFGIKEKLAFGQVKQAMDAFKALNGSLPKSHAEFMTKIIKDNGIVLPALPDGNVYEYDPKSSDLYVAPARDK